ncbi:hypothetical protein [Thalassospira sp. HJ]|uniref:hypothetical protein n=1 Tax=Thalassospira sp. HJ TaxID=1616823 RepID=UPI001F2376AB|nr:hypothetical protein [Thalassospira sp. HJ]
MRNRICFFAGFALVFGLLWLLVGCDLLAAVKQLEALPDDNEDQSGKDDFRKT